MGLYTLFLKIILSQMVAQHGLGRLAARVFCIHLHLCLQFFLPEVISYHRSRIITRFSYILLKYVLWAPKLMQCDRTHSMSTYKSYMFLFISNFERRAILRTPRIGCFRTRANISRKNYLQNVVRRLLRQAARLEMLKFQDSTLDLSLSISSQCLENVKYLTFCLF